MSLADELLSIAEVAPPEEPERPLSLSPPSEAECLLTRAARLRHEARVLELRAEMIVRRKAGLEVGHG